MVKQPLTAPNTALSTLCDQVLDLGHDAQSLIKQIEKLPFENHGIDEPVKYARMCNNAAIKLLELSRAILGRLELVEQKVKIEATLRARMKAPD